MRCQAVRQFSNMTYEFPPALSRLRSPNKSNLVSIDMTSSFNAILCKYWTLFPIVYDEKTNKALEIAITPFTITLKIAHQPFLSYSSPSVQYVLATSSQSLHICVVTLRRYHCRSCGSFVLAKASDYQKLCSSCQTAIAIRRKREAEVAASWDSNPIASLISWFFGPPVTDGLKARQIGYGSAYIREEYYWLCAIQSAHWRRHLDSSHTCGDYNSSP